MIFNDELSDPEIAILLLLGLNCEKAKQNILEITKSGFTDNNTMSNRMLLRQRLQRIAAVILIADELGVMRHPGLPSDIKTATLEQYSHLVQGISKDDNVVLPVDVPRQQDLTVDFFSTGKDE